MYSFSLQFLGMYVLLVALKKSKQLLLIKQPHSHLLPPVVVVKRGSADGRRREARLTFGTDQTAVVPDWTAVFKNEDCDGHDSQTHDEHHHPDRWTVWFYRDR